MSQRILFFAQAALAAGLLGVHALALQNEWYWYYLWIDVPMHFVGGLWAALAVTWLARACKLRASFALVLFGVIVIGFLWEAFEYLTGFQPELNNGLDTALDLLMDVLGGIFGFFITRRRAARDIITTNGEQIQDRSS